MENYNRSVIRGIGVLNHLATFSGGSTLKEISVGTGLNSSTLYRILLTLINFEYVVKDNNSKYFLGPAVLYLSAAYQKNFNIRIISNQFLSRLRDHSGETITLSKRQNKEVLYLEKLTGLEAIGVTTENIGERSPLHCTAVGKVILANISKDELDDILDGYNFLRKTPKTITNKDDLLDEIEEIRRVGYAFNKEENSEGLVGISAPVFDRDGVFGGVSISGLASRIYEKSASGELARDLIKTCKEISVILGGGDIIQELEKRKQD